jgi:hypothetical protein
MEKRVMKCITIRKEQNDFIREEGLPLSRFVQGELDEFMKLRKKFQMFKKEVDEDEKRNEEIKQD